MPGARAPRRRRRRRGCVLLIDRSVAIRAPLTPRAQVRWLRGQRRGLSIRYPSMRHRESPAGSSGRAWPRLWARTSEIHWSCWYSWLMIALRIVPPIMVGEALGGDLGDPLCVLVLVVEVGGARGSGGHGELVGCCDVAGGDGADAVVDALGDGGSEGTQAVDGRQRAAELLGVGGVHDPVEVGVGTRFGGGEVADHEVGDVRLVAQVPADGRGVLVRSPDDLVGVEIPPEVLGVGQGPVVLGEQFGQGLEAVVHIGSLL